MVNVLLFNIILSFYTVSITEPASNPGFWLGATFLDPDYIFDGNFGKVKSFQMNDGTTDYFVQVNVQKCRP